MSQPESDKIIFGYWALRGKAHVIRLMMEHLNIPYEEVTYRTPQSWYEDPLAKSNRNLELPYLIDKDFMIDESVPVLTYVLKKNGHESYLGNSIQDQAHVDMYLWSMENVFRKLICLSLKKLETVQELTKLREEFWKRTFEPKLQSIQNFLTPGNWYLNYLTFIDFDLHEVVNYVRILYPKRISAFPKIEEIERRISELPGIKAFNTSEKNRNLCFLPVQMCKKFKSESQRS